LFEAGAWNQAVDVVVQKGIKSKSQIPKTLVNELTLTLTSIFVLVTHDVPPKRSHFVSLPQRLQDPHLRSVVSESAAEDRQDELLDAFRSLTSR
jgi:hypothetical protein